MSKSFLAFFPSHRLKNEWDDVVWASGFFLSLPTPDVLSCLFHIERVCARRYSIMLDTYKPTSSSWWSVCSPQTMESKNFNLFFFNVSHHLFSPSSLCHASVLFGTKGENTETGDSNTDNGATSYTGLTSPSSPSPPSFPTLRFFLLLCIKVVDGQVHLIVLDLPPINLKSREKTSSKDLPQ